MCIDVDESDPEKVKDLLSRDPYVSSVFASARGYGAAVIVKIASDDHLATFQWLEKYFFEQYKIIIDRSCKDVSRARFVSFDPNLYYNPKAEVCKKKLSHDKQKVPRVVFVQSDFDNIVQQLTQRQINICESYHDWLRVGFALSTHFGDNGRGYFHNISAMSGKYSPEQCDTQYNNCLKATGHGVTIGTLYYMAKKAGIETYSAKTRKIASAASGLKANGSSADLITKNLEKFGGFSPIDSAEIVAQILQNDAQVDDPSLIDQIRMFLYTTYSIKLNVISRHVEIDGHNLTDNLFNTIFLEVKQRFNKATVELVTQILHSAYTPTYNPIHDFYAEHEHIRHTGAIKALMGTIESPTGFEGSFRPDYVEYFGTRWLVGLIAASFWQHSPLVMVLAGEKQNTGKTEWFRRLLPRPLANLYAESKLDREKDDEILMTQKWIVMDDEMGGKNKQENKRLKELTSKQIFTLRAPYGRFNEDLPRLAVMCGTSNDTDLLSDPTGNRRIIPIKVDAINQASYNLIDKTAVIMEAYHLYKSGFEWRFSGQDIIILNDNTEEFVQAAVEEELLSKYFKAGKSPFTTTEVKVRLETISGQKLNINKLGQALKKIAGKRKPMRDGSGMKQVYMLEELNVSTAYTPLNTTFSW